jgi:hypothetical protein
MKGLIAGVFYAVVSFLLLFVLLQPSHWLASPSLEISGLQGVIAGDLGTPSVEQLNLKSSSDPAASSGAFLEQALHSAASDELGLIDSEDPNEEDPLLISPGRLPARLGKRHLPESRSFSLRSEQFIHRPPIA